MIELPEAVVLARQIDQALAGRTITSAIANHSPHKLAWYYGDPESYGSRLHGRKVQSAAAQGGLVEILAEDMRLLFGDGISLRLLEAGTKRPEKHQLLVQFADGAALMASVQMYGGIWAFPAGEFSNPYYQIACDKPSPLSEGFNDSYFASLLDDRSRKKSAKAFLATEQRVPGLGNGVLQDILWNARIHPRRSMDLLSEDEFGSLFEAVKSTLRQMVLLGGRDTERDLYGQPGGYLTRLSKNTVNQPCPVCASAIKKETYLGGSIYYCAGCQRAVRD